MAFAAHRAIPERADMSVCLLHLFHYVAIIVSSWNFQELLPLAAVMSMQMVKVRGQRSMSQRSKPDLAISDCNSSLNSHMAMEWCTKLDVAYRRGALWFFKVICQISRSRGTKKIADFDLNWVFPDRNPSLWPSNSFGWFSPSVRPSFSW